METVINIDPKLYKEAERLATNEKKSLDTVIEDFLKSFINSRIHKTVKITPFVRKLGTDMNLPADYDYKTDYRNYVAEKSL